MATIRNGIQAARQIFSPKLVEHIPGEKRVYRNFLGTKTTFSLKKSNSLVPVVEKPYDTIVLYGKNVPKDMYTKESLERTFNNDIPIDTPIKETFFTKAKTYLFGLIRGKSKTMETINIGDRIIARGELKDMSARSVGDQAITRERWFDSTNGSEFISLPDKCIIKDGSTRKVVS